MPNIDFIVEHKADLLGLVLTHAHEDHLGAVGYLWNELECPIYATPFTAAVLRPKLKEEGNLHRVKIHEVKADKHIELGPFKLEMIGLTHSIPEMQAIAIRTDAGIVMHTGDWKLDEAPMVGPVTDEARLKQYGDEGVLAMVCDSTNVMVEGESGSESHVRQNLTQVIAGCENRVLVTTFASNIARLESILYAARDAGRSVGLAGKSLWRITDAAKQAGYLKDAPPFLSDHEAMKLPKDKCLIVCTGCQGESRAALTKIAQQEHPAIRLSPKDTVIFSARTIPGNESRIGWMQNKLTTLGLDIISDRDGFIHVSGHPCRGELERMYKLVRPQISIPVHGEARHIHEHAKLAQSLGVPETIEATNGAVIELKKGETPRVVGLVTSGYIAMDGNSLIDTNSIVLRTRRKLRDAGCVVLSMVIDKKGKVVGLPQISGPGTLDPAADKHIIEMIQKETAIEIEKIIESKKERMIDERLRGIMRRILNAEIGKKPVLDIHIHQM